MQENYQECLEMILHHEGGYVNHPEDPGGATNLGVTKRVYEEWVGRTVTLDKMEQLQVSDVAPIYKKNYWDRVKGDQLPSGLDLCVFDFGVNAGPVRSAKMLQSCVDATEDGVIGPKTLARVSEQDTEELIKLFSVKREEYYKSLKHFETFGRGWLRRNEDVRDTAIDMI